MNIPEGTEIFWDYRNPKTRMPPGAWVVLTSMTEENGKIRLTMQRRGGLACVATVFDPATMKIIGAEGDARARQALRAKHPKLKLKPPSR
jgi:hypothetical protein